MSVPALRKRLACACVVAAILALAVISWRFVTARPSTSTVPLLVDANTEVIAITAMFNGKPLRFAINTLVPHSVIRRSRAGLKATGPSARADVRVGRYTRRFPVFIVPDRSIRNGLDGVLGNDYFEGTGIHGRGVNGARITIDMVQRSFTIDSNPSRGRLAPASGGIALRLRQQDPGLYLTSIPLNYGRSFDFAVGIGLYEVVLPTGSVLWIDPQTLTYMLAIGRVPVSLSLGGHDVPSFAVGMPQLVPIGCLGMSLLGSYRIVIDYRDRIMCLNPPRT